MDANVTVDIGKNITILIEKLAAAIGTTAQQVFPWYVKQQYLQGWISLSIIVFLLVAFSSVFLWSCPKAKWNEGNMYCVVVIVSGIVLVFTIMLSCLGVLPSAITSIMNPEYSAMHALIRDLSMLR